MRLPLPSTYPLFRNRGRRRAVAVLAAGAALAMVVGMAGSGVAAIAQRATGGPVYRDAKAPVDARVRDLLRQMTLEEKVGQMDQIVIGKLKAASPPANGDCNGGNNDPLQPVCLEKVLITDRTGSILAGGTDNPRDNTGRGWAEQYNTIQRYAIELRSLTGGRGRFNAEHDHYDVLPAHLVDTVKRDVSDEA